MKDVRAILNNMGYGMEALGESNPEAWGSLNSFIGAAFTDGSVSSKNKELIAIAIFISNF